VTVGVVAVFGGAGGDVVVELGLGVGGEDLVQHRPRTGVTLGMQHVLGPSGSGGDMTISTATFVIAMGAIRIGVGQPPRDNTPEPLRVVTAGVPDQT